LRTVKFLLSMSGDDYLRVADDEKMYAKLNETSELERFRNRHTQSELQRFVDVYRGLWEPYFEANMDAEVPLHPWKVLKKARETYAEEENGGDWPDMEQRHALRVVKDEYTARWRDLAYED